MDEQQLQELVALAAGVSTSDVTVKERRGAQIKANGLWEGSCSPAARRKEVGLFLATDGAELAASGAVRRLTLELPFPEAIVVAANLGMEDERVSVAGYGDSAVAERLAAAFGTDLLLVDRPKFKSKTPVEPPTVDANTLWRNLAENPNVILQGPPGTGKTSTAMELVRSIAVSGGMTPETCRYSHLVKTAGGPENLLANKDLSSAPAIVWELVQLHPSYAYDDLVRRIAPRANDDGELVMEVSDGVFPRLCQLAEERGPDKPVLLILDEINRGNLAAILGELIFAIDPGHRGTAVRLQYQGPGLSPTISVPRNLWIVGTMNTADRSLAMVDYAVRRRFRFLEVPSDPEVLSRWYADRADLAAISRELYECCNAGLPPRLQVGHSAFLEKADPEESWRARLARRVAYHVLPLLSEYAKEGLRGNEPVDYQGVQLDINSSRVAESALRQAIKLP